MAGIELGRSGIILSADHVVQFALGACHPLPRISVGSLAMQELLSPRPSPPTTIEHAP